MNAFAEDLVAGLRLWRFWIALAWDDLVHRYKRTIVGVIWIPASFSAFILAKVYIFGLLNAVALDYFAAFVTLGFLSWQLISAVIVDGCTSLTSAEAFIRSQKIPYSVFIYQTVARNMMVMVLTIPAVVAIGLIVGIPVHPTAFAALGALFIYVLNGIWVGIVLGMISARYRDLEHLVQTAMRILFFVSPIIFVPAALGEFGRYIAYNPFFHYIEIFRAPIIDGNLAPASWGVVLVITVAGFACAALTYAASRRHIPFWV